MPVWGLLLALLLVFARAGPAAAAGGTDADWPTFDHDVSRSGVAVGGTAINSGNLHRLRRRTVNLDGTVDSSPIQLRAITISGRRRDVVVVTTSYGKTIALDPLTGTKLWEFVPPGISAYAGTSQITEASPVADPDRQYVYSASPDGLIHKLDVRTGHELWSARVTLSPSSEKISSALNLSGSSVIVTVSGYFDHEPYIGHVVTVDRASGRVTHVFNALCSNMHVLIAPEACPETSTQTGGGSSIWARAGAVVEPRTGRLLVATANGPFNGSSDWGDSVLELSTQLTVLHNWTPADAAQLERADQDLGSTAPALLPPYHGYHLAVQGGKQGVLSLLNVDRLNGTSAGAGARMGGELQDIRAPARQPVYGAPAVWSSAGRIYVFVGDFDATAAYELVGGGHPRLRLVWDKNIASTSPLIVDGLLYAYGCVRGVLRVMAPLTGKVLVTLPAGHGHWNSPIVVGGRIILPEGDANAHRTSGVLDIYHLPGW